MASITTIFLFFVYTWCLGYSFTFFLKNSENYLERNLMRIGIGLGVIPLVGVILSLFKIPIDWKLFLAASLIIPIYSFFKNKPYKRFEFPKPKLTKSNLVIIAALLIFIFTLYMYEKGAFAYPYLEDDDSWDHARSASYVASEKTTIEPKGMEVFHYIDPYPPGYAILMGVLRQTSDSIMWTLKFFNALIISLGIIFFYFFALKFTGSRESAIAAAFVLAMIPCYLSHFIWAISLAVTLVFPLLYCLHKIDEDNKWAIPASLVFAGILLTQPTHPIKIAFMLAAYFLIRSIYRKKIQWIAIGSVIFGALLSITWWATKLSALGKSNYGRTGGNTFSVEGGNIIIKALGIIKKTFPNYSGTGTRAYTFSDFFFTQKQNMINNPIGIGIFICLIAIIAIILLSINYKRMPQQKKESFIVTLSWLLITFLLVNSMTFNLPIGIFAFRAWMLLAIPVALICGEGIVIISKAANIKIARIAIAALLIFGVIITSGYAKYYHNTNPGWPPGALWSYIQAPEGVSSPELQGYLWMNNNLPTNTKVFVFTSDKDYYLTGLDLFTCTWCKDEIDYRETAINRTAQELSSWLKEKKFEYIAMSSSDVQMFGPNITNSKINEIGQSGLFQPVHQNQGIVVFRVV